MAKERIGTIAAPKSINRSLVANTQSSNALLITGLKKLLSPGDVAQKRK
jgi:hypothetical protein